MKRGWALSIICLAFFAISVVAQAETPSPPQILQKGRETDGVRIVWEPVVNAVEYKVYKSTDRQSFIFMASTTETQYVEFDLGTQTYYYYVTAVSPLGEESEASNIGRVTPPSTVQIVGDQLRIIDIKATSVTIEWQANTPPYDVYMDGVLISYGQQETTLTASGLSPGQTYTFKVIEQRTGYETNTVKVTPFGDVVGLDGSALDGIRQAIEDAFGNLFTPTDTDGDGTPDSVEQLLPNLDDLMNWGPIGGLKEVQDSLSDFTGSVTGDNDPGSVTDGVLQRPEGDVVIDPELPGYDQSAAESELSIGPEIQYIPGVEASKMPLLPLYLLPYDLLEDIRNLLRIIVWGTFFFMVWLWLKPTFTVGG